MDRHRPPLRSLAQRQKQQLQRRFFVRKSATGFDDFAQRPVQRFHTVGGVDCFADVRRVMKIEVLRSKITPRNGYATYASLSPPGLRSFSSLISSYPTDCFSDSISPPPGTNSSAAGNTKPPGKVNCTNNGTYGNSKGQTVRRPENCSRPPKGATAQCHDGSYSFSQSRRGTCSHHGRVTKWL